MDVKNYIKNFEKRTQQLKKSKKSSRIFLIKAGIHTSEGVLTVNYGGNK